MNKPIKAYGLSRPMKKALTDALDNGMCCPRMNTRASLIDRGLLWPGLHGDYRTAELTPNGEKVAKWIRANEIRREKLSQTIFDRTPIAHVLLDPHGDPWIRVPGGVVEVVMRPSNGGPPVRILHPPEDFDECEEFGPFTQVEDA